MKPIGVLCLQGDFREHLAALDAIGVSSVRVRKPSDLAGISGLIIPGGESTVIDKLSRNFGLRDPIIESIRAGLPVFGTCAGLILLSNSLIDGAISQETFGGLDVTVKRNAFGSQLDSFEADVPFLGIDNPVHCAFIRAPIVVDVGSEVDVLATLPDGRIVGVRQGSLLGISFHPEVTGDTSLHEYFVSMCKEASLA